MSIRKISLPALFISSALFLGAGLTACSDDSSSSSASETDSPTDPGTNPSDEPGKTAPETKDTTFLTPDVPTPEGGYSGVLVGTCEKGPLKSGSAVILQDLSETDLAATGKKTSATVTDDFGTYSLQYSGFNAFAMQEASGIFLNELTGDQTGSVTLRSLIRVP